MSDLFDSLKKNKEKSTGKKRNARELSPVKLPFSDDEDSDNVVLKKPTKSPVKNSRATKMSPATKRLLFLMKKCKVRLPKDKDGRLLQKIHAEWKKQRRNNIKNKKNNKSPKAGNKYPIVKIQNIAKSSPPKQSRATTRTPESTKKVKAATEVNKKTTPAKVYVKFPLSTPNSNRKKKTYAKTPLKKDLKPRPRGYAIASKRLNATPALVREFGKRFFMSYVRIHNDNLVQLVKNPKVKSSPKIKKRKLNSSVRFNDEVEIFGSESEEENKLPDPMPVSLVTAMNGDFESTSTPPPKRGRPKSSSVSSEKKKPILTPAEKKNYRISDEKRVIPTNQPEEEEDDDAEYIVPTEMSPPKKQATPPRASTEKSPSPEKEDTSVMPSEPEPEAESILDPEPTEPASETSAAEPMAEETNNEPELIADKEKEDEDQVEAVDDEPVAANEEDEEPKNNSHGNDFENDEDSQGQNIVQDFISRTVQDLSHDDSEDIQDDEELVDDKRNSSPSAINEPADDVDDDSVSNKISRMYQCIKDKVLGGPDDNPEAMETDNL